MLAVMEMSRMQPSLLLIFGMVLLVVTLLAEGELTSMMLATGASWCRIQGSYTRCAALHGSVERFLNTFCFFFFTHVSI